MAATPELDLNRDTVEFIIDKAHEFHAKEAVTIPEEPLSPSDDWARQVLADHADDPTFQEVQATVEDLDPYQRVMLVALMWVGRGDYGIDEWDDALRAASDGANERTADYLLGTPLVADYLSEGLEIFSEVLSQEEE